MESLVGSNAATFKGNVELARLIMSKLNDDRSTRSMEVDVSRMLKGEGAGIEKYQTLHKGLKAADINLRRFVFETDGDEELADVFEFAEANREKILLLMKQSPDENIKRLYVNKLTLPAADIVEKPETVDRSD